MKVAIIGGGAAGLMAAATLQTTRPDADIFLIDRNDGLGKKVIISGGGRCNVTTGIRDVRELLTNYPRGSKFLNSAMHGFPPGDVYDWFESHGVPLKTQDDNRVFPRSDDGKDIVGVFEKTFKDSGVRVWLKSCVSDVRKTAGGKFEISFKNSGEALLADRVILTTGGRAYRQTGSTGDGYAFAISLGHTLTALAPSLNSFTTEESWPAKISGMSFTQATIFADRDISYAHTGPFLFTHKGISGPAVFAVSSLVAFEEYDALNPLCVAIDLFPDESTEEMTARIGSAAKQTPTRSFLNVLATLIPKSLAEICIEETGVSGDKNAAEAAKKEILAVATWLKAIPLNVVDRGSGDEFVTAGGIPRPEIDPSTMESKICPGLYFAGEIMDIDGFTGGFNLQASWATGRLAGMSAAGSEG
ncbi:MAG: NAD(P)/FAD-dependent oxidoreductase [Patescibacteria group bacterium]|nr:NAD(P)/FAD-dependent oxidoreductase [Patescibacteria group bacterium]